MSKKDTSSGTNKQQAPLPDKIDDFLQTDIPVVSTVEAIASIAKIGNQLTEHCLPRWQDIPDFGLYMDQVLVIINRCLGNYPRQEDKQLTSAMVNNYVKMGIVPSPVKKKYGRTHIAQLLVICTLKSVLPIDSIRKLLHTNLAIYPDEVFYSSFAAFYSQSNRAAATALHNTETDILQAILLASLRSQAEQAIAVAALTTLASPYKGKQKK